MTISQESSPWLSDHLTVGEMTSIIKQKLIKAFFSKVFSSSLNFDHHCWDHRSVDLSVNIETSSAEAMWLTRWSTDHSAADKAARWEAFGIQRAWTSKRQS